MEYVKLTKKGFVSFKLDKAKSKKFKKQPISNSYINKETSEIKSFNSDQELKDFFYDSHLIDGNNENILPFLTEKLIIDENITIDDFHNAIQQHLVLEGIICSCFPEYPKINNFDKNADCVADNLIISKELKISPNDQNSCFYNQGFTNNRNWVGSTKLEIDSNFRIYLKDEIFEGEINFSLWDLIVGLFETKNKDTVFVSADGIYKNGVKLENPICELNSWCSLSEDLKVKDIFNIVKNDLMLKTFFSCYSWCSFIDDIHSCAEENIDEPELEDVWFTEVYNIISFDDLEEFGNFVDFGFGFHGVGERKFENQKDPEPVNYSLSLSPINEIANLDLTYKNSSAFYQNNQEKCTFSLKITLQEFIHAIYWDLSFYGSPKNTHLIHEELKEELEDIKNKINYLE